MIPKVNDPALVKIIIAGIVAIAHFTIKTTIDGKDIFMSVTTTSLLSFNPMDYSLSNIIWLNVYSYGNRSFTKGFSLPYMGLIQDGSLFFTEFTYFDTE